MKWFKTPAFGKAETWDCIHSPMFTYLIAFPLVVGSFLAMTSLP